MNPRKLKPILRPDAKYDVQLAIQNPLLKLIEAVDPIYKSCLNCINFREQNELCGLCNQRPPARVIAYGCRMWEDVDEIPF